MNLSSAPHAFMRIPDRAASVGNQSPQRRLPSPASSRSQNTLAESKRKRCKSNELCQDEQRPLKKPRADSSPLEVEIGRTTDPVACWVETGYWSKALGAGNSSMVQTSLGKRKSSSTHYSERAEQLAQNGIFMKGSTLVQKTSKDLCNTYLQGSHTPDQFPCYPSERVSDVLERIQTLNEARLQRDVTPWIVPSIENLRFSNKIDADSLGEEVQAEWIRCMPMGGTKPKPDYTAGVLRRAFTTQEVEKLQNYTTPDRPWLITPNLCFPFLICEAKNGEVGMGKANRQNIHSASIAVKAIFELYKAAYMTKTADPVQDLYGQILVFSVSHNNEQANLYGHYAVVDKVKGGLEFYRHEIDIFSLTLHDGARRFKPYNFVFNLYKQFAPVHIQRIKNAIALLPNPDKRTELLDLDVEEASSPQSTEQIAHEDRQFRTPSEPASVIQRKKLEQQLLQQRQESQEREQQFLQQRQESMDREQKLREELEQQMSAADIKLEKRRHATDLAMEQQRQESQAKLEQQRQESQAKLEQQRQESQAEFQNLRQQLAEMMTLLKQRV